MEAKMRGDAYQPMLGLEKEFLRRLPDEGAPLILAGPALVVEKQPDKNK
jgi:hypothetical protein